MLGILLAPVKGSGGDFDQCVQDVRCFVDLFSPALLNLEKVFCLVYYFVQSWFPQHCGAV